MDSRPRRVPLRSVSPNASRSPRRRPAQRTVNQVEDTPTQLILINNAQKEKNRLKVLRKSHESDRISHSAKQLPDIERSREERHHGCFQDRYSVAPPVSAHGQSTRKRQQSPGKQASAKRKQDTPRSVRNSYDWQENDEKHFTRSIHAGNDDDCTDCDVAAQSPRSSTNIRMEPPLRRSRSPKRPAFPKQQASLWEMARIYSTVHMQQLKQMQYRELLYRQQLLGFNTIDDYKKYLSYLAHDRKKPFSQRLVSPSRTRITDIETNQAKARKSSRKRHARSKSPLLVKREKTEMSLLRRESKSPPKVTQLKSSSQSRLESSLHVSSKPVHSKASCDSSLRSQSPESAVHRQLSHQSISTTSCDDAAQYSEKRRKYLNERDTADSTATENGAYIRLQPVKRDERKRNNEISTWASQRNSSEKTSASAKRSSTKSEHTRSDRNAIEETRRNKSFQQNSTKSARGHNDVKRTSDKVIVIPRVTHESSRSKDQGKNAVTYDHVNKCTQTQIDESTCVPLTAENLYLHSKVTEQHDDKLPPLFIEKHEEKPRAMESLPEIFTPSSGHKANDEENIALTQMPESLELNVEWKASLEELQRKRQDADNSIENEEPIDREIKNQKDTEEREADNSQQQVLFNSFDGDLGAVADMQNHEKNGAIIAKGDASTESEFPTVQENEEQVEFAEEEVKTELPEISPENKMATHKLPKTEVHQSVNDGFTGIDDSTLAETSQAILATNLLELYVTTKLDSRTETDKESLPSPMPRNDIEDGKGTDIKGSNDEVPASARQNTKKKKVPTATLR